TPTTGVPAPGCANYTGGDVWFQVTVPAGGSLVFNSQSGSMTNGGMAIYSGTCTSLTLIDCDDDGSLNYLMPMIVQAGLAPGSTVFIRFWGYGTNAGTFGICVTTLPPPNVQDCPGAIPICQNVYSTTVSYSGEGNIPGEISSSISCLGSGEKNDVWY